MPELEARTGQPLEGTILHSDQDGVYTSYDWLRRVLLDDGLRVSYSERGAKDNPWIEALWGRMKTEEDSRSDQAPAFPELERLIDERFQYYNRERRHSQIGYVSPLEYLANVLDQSVLTCPIAPAA